MTDEEPKANVDFALRIYVMKRSESNLFPHMLGARWSWLDIVTIHSSYYFVHIYMYTYIYLRCACVCVLCMYVVYMWCVACMSFYNPVPTSNSGNWELQKRRRTWDSFFFLFLLFLFSKISPQMLSFPCNTPFKSTLHLFTLSLSFLLFLPSSSIFPFPFSYPLAGYYPLNPQAR